MHVALRARIHHETGSWIFQTGASNAFNSVFRKPMLEQVAACTPALTGFVAKCYGERPASVFFQMDSGERAKLEYSLEVQQEDAMGPVLFCLPLRPVLTRVGEEYESQGVEAYAYRRHHYRGRRDITRDGGSSTLPRERVGSEGHTPQPGCLGPKGQVR